MMEHHGRDPPFVEFEPTPHIITTNDDDSISDLRKIISGSTLNKSFMTPQFARSIRGEADLFNYRLHNLPDDMIHLIEEFLGHDVPTISYFYLHPLFITDPDKHVFAPYSTVSRLKVTVHERCGFNDCPSFDVSFIYKDKRIWQQVNGELQSIQGYVWTNCKGNTVRRLFAETYDEFQSLRSPSLADTVQLIKQMMYLNSR
jgi:hypothetical protein